jgi:hypothetical protein
VKKLPQDEQYLGNIYNGIVAFVVFLQAVLVMYSNYYLNFFVASASNPNHAYRMLANSGKLVGILTILTFIPMFGIFAMIMIQLNMNCTGSAGNILNIAGSAVFLVLHLFFSYSLSHIFPYNMWGWSTLASPWMYLFPRMRTDARKHGQVLLAEATKVPLLVKRKTNAETYKTPSCEPLPLMKLYAHW